jgi:putative ABC transport system permease protein
MLRTFTVMHIGVLDLLYAWQANLLLILLTGVISMAYLTISAYQAGLETAFPPIDSTALLVQQTQTTGEINGSRIPASVETRLLSLGVGPAIPEIHTIVGTSAQDITLLRGVDPARYRQVLSFDLQSGSVLDPNTPSRQAMLGWRLAQRRSAFPGGTIRLRGRDFTVLGIFYTGTYADNEAWVSISDAQALLGWKDEVSIFIISNNGILKSGMELSGGLGVIRRGEGIQADLRHTLALFDLIHSIARLAGLTAAVALATVLLRLAWLRRRNIAILRSIGFTRRGLVAYLFAQSAVIAVVGTSLGLLVSMLLTTRLLPSSFGLDVLPQYNAATIWSGVAWTAGITLFGMLAPAIWLSRLALTDLLYRG